MPTAPRRHAATHGAPCKRHDTRPNAAARGYGHAWHLASTAFRRDHPLCTKCLADGTATPATVVDHTVPHRGDLSLFWDRGNWQSLCKHHHDAKTAREDGGFGRRPPA